MGSLRRQADDMLASNNATHSGVVAVYHVDGRGKEALIQSDHQSMSRNTGKTLPPKVKTARKPDILKSRYVTVLMVAKGSSRCQSE